MDVILFLFPAITLSVLLVGIHTYLGLHVLEREVVFVDIGLSQVAALGGAISLLFFHDHDGPNYVSILCSLGLCLFAALGLSILRNFEKKVSQEALIGITYALASGALILILDKSPHGAEHLKEAFIGNILFVTWNTVFITSMIYGLVGIIHYIFRKVFWQSSRGKKTNLFWDFLFYFLFGIVITFSTHHAGVLVVFSILVIPAALAKRFRPSASIFQQLLFAWSYGFVSILLSFLLSYYQDLPAGAAIVTTLATGFFLLLFAKMLQEKILPSICKQDQ